MTLTVGWQAGLGVLSGRRGVSQPVTCGELDFTRPHTAEPTTCSPFAPLRPLSPATTATAINLPAGQPVAGGTMLICVAVTGSSTAVAPAIGAPVVPSRINTVFALTLSGSRGLLKLTLPGVSSG